MPHADDASGRPLTVLYDGEMFTTQRAGGVNRYFAQIIERLPSDWSPVLTTAEKRELIFPRHPGLRVHHWQRYGFRPGRVSFAIEPHYFRAAVRRARPDVVHPTDYRLLTRLPFDRVRQPLVVTVHDMIHERFAAQMDPHGRVAAEKRAAVSAADMILCISENTRRDLLATIDVPEDRIVVAHLASGLDPSLAGDPVSGAPYFLHVGSRAAGYKNFARLLAAFAQVASRTPDVRLRVVGVPLTDDEERVAGDLGIRDRIDLDGFVDDARLAALYRDALALVYPSLYEGFGIPPLEGAACGAAVAVSRVASLPEVMGDVAAWFDPESVDDMAATLQRLVDDDGFRRDLAARGPGRAAQFSWDRTAAETAAVYRRVAS